MNVFIIGASGYLGTHAIKALAPSHRLRLSDVKPPEQDPGHEFLTVDVASLDQLLRAAEGMDAIINCSVVAISPDSPPQPGTIPYALTKSLVTRSAACSPNTTTSMSSTTSGTTSGI